MFRTEVPEVSSLVHSFLVLEYLDQFKYPCLVSLYSVILLCKILQCYAVSIFFPTTPTLRCCPLCQMVMTLYTFICS